METEKEKRDLDKLGTVLAMCNDTNRRSLDLLERQQKRQVRMVWAVLVIVAVAFAVVGYGTYCTYSALDSLTQTVKEFHYDKIEETSEGPFSGFCNKE